MYPHINPTTTHFINAAKYTFRNYIDHAIIFRARDRICRITNPIPSLLARIELLHRRRIYSVAKFTARLGSVLSGFARCHGALESSRGAADPLTQVWQSELEVSMNDERRTNSLRRQKYATRSPERRKHGRPEAEFLCSTKEIASPTVHQRIRALPPVNKNNQQSLFLQKAITYFWVIDNRVTRRGTGKSSRWYSRA